jgi:hypothetical protein
VFCPVLVVVVVALSGYQSHANRNAIVSVHSQACPSLHYSVSCSQECIIDSQLLSVPSSVSARRRVLGRSVVAVVGSLGLLQLNVVAVCVVGSSVGYTHVLVHVKKI